MRRRPGSGWWRSEKGSRLWTLGFSRKPKAEVSSAPLDVVLPDRDAVHHSIGQMHQRIVGRADDRVAVTIERRVEQHSHARRALERPNELRVARVHVVADDLRAQGAVHVYDRGNLLLRLL